MHNCCIGFADENNSQFSILNSQLKRRPEGLPFYLAAATAVVVAAGIVTAAAAQQQDQDYDPPAAVIAIATKETVTHKNTSRMEFSSSFAAHSMVFPGRKNVQNKKEGSPPPFLSIFVLDIACVLGFILRPCQNGQHQRYDHTDGNHGCPKSFLIFHR